MEATASCAAVPSSILHPQKPASYFRRRLLATALPLRLRRLESRVRDDQMPYHALEGLGVGRDMGWVNGWHNHTHIGHLGRIAAVAPDNTADARADLSSILKCPHQVRADIAGQVATAHRKNTHQIIAVEAAAP